MATRLDDKIFVNGGYLDSNISVTSIAELIEKESSNAFFLGQSVHMPEAFTSVNEIPYPVDFWSTPNGENIKWEIKNMPALESSDDLERFKVFCDDFKSEAGYYPMTNGSKILVDGEEFELHIDDDGVAKWGSTQAIFDDTISDAVKLAVEEITSGVSEAFDTLKEVEDWINANSGKTDTSAIEEEIGKLKESAHTHENKDILDTIDESKIGTWDEATKAEGTFLNEAIHVTNDLGNYKNGMTIEDGTSVMEVLKNFLKQTLYPEAASKPNAEIKLNNELAIECEVGSLIEIPTINIETIEGKFNYKGYNGTEAKDGTFSKIQLKSELVNGFENYVPTVEFVDAPIEGQNEIRVVEGENIIKISGKAEYNAPSNLPTTNEGIETTQTASTATDNLATWENGTIDMEKILNVKGYRKVYFGAINANDEISETLIKTLNSNDKEVTENIALEIKTLDSENTNRMIIAVPANKTLQLVEDSTSTQDLTKLLLNTEKQVEISSANGYDTITYNVYDKSWAGSFGNEIWKIIIKNK